jgi:hypothetical protein
MVGVCRTELDIIRLTQLAAFSAVTDIICSILPCTFILKMKVPKSQKILIAILMSGGGLLAGVAIARIPVNISLLASRDPTWDSIGIALLTTIEMYAGIILVCLPSLGFILTRFLRRIDRLSGKTGGHTASLNYIDPDSAADTLPQTTGTTDTSITKQSSETHSCSNASEKTYCAADYPPSMPSSSSRARRASADSGMV